MAEILGSSLKDSDFPVAVCETFLTTVGFSLGCGQRVIFLAFLGGLAGSHFIRVAAVFVRFALGLLLIAAVLAAVYFAFIK